MDKRAQIVKALQENTPVCWILWEMRNLYATFNVGETNGPEIVLTNTEEPKTHQMVDTIENVTSACMHVLGLDPANMELIDSIEDIELILSKDGFTNRFTVK